MVAFGECGFAAEIPAFAGMEDGRRRQLKEFPFPRKRESRGAASSATHRRQATLVSASRNFPLTREEIPAFAGMERGAGMEDGGRRQLKEFPFPRKRESPCILIVLERDAKRLVRDSGRFPLSREWECFFLRKKKINPRRPLPVMLLEFRRRYFRRPVWGRARF